MSTKPLDRREFAALLPALFATAALLPESARAQAATPRRPLATLTSGTFTPGPPSGSAPGRKSRAYTRGLLKAGNIQIEMHQTTQQEGAVHEPVGTHLHNEIWFVKQGTCELYINGTTHTLNVGDVGIVCAGDEHWIRNAGPGECNYFVVTVGPPE